MKYVYLTATALTLCLAAGNLQAGLPWTNHQVAGVAATSAVASALIEKKLSVVERFSDNVSEHPYIATGLVLVVGAATWAYKNAPKSSSTKD